MPALGMAQETGKLVRWLKQEGETVVKGQPLMEVETDKAAVEIEAPASGTLSNITAAEGDDIAVGLAIAWILGPGESPPAAKVAVSAQLREDSPAAQQVAAAAARAVVAPAGRPAASPKARRLAAEKGIDISHLHGTGPGGAVLEEDISQAGAGAAAAEPALWRAMADNVSRGWRETPHFFVMREIDATGLVAERKRQPAAVTYSDLLVRSVAQALRSHPRMNGSKDEVNIGLAVAVPDGLIVPVIHQADRMSIIDLAARREQLLGRVRSGHIRAGDLTGGTFTISNLGMYGVDMFTAILTGGQVGILAVGRIAERVVAREGNAVVRPTMQMSLSCDHRQVDGARAAEFVQTLVGLLETP